MNTDEITIEKGIPLPPLKQVGNRWGKGAKWAQTLRNMEIGDSFLAPADRMSAIYVTCKRNGWKIRTQTQPYVPGQKIATLRIWLVAVLQAENQSTNNSDGPASVPTTNNYDKI